MVYKKYKNKFPPLCWSVSQLGFIDMLGLCHLLRSFFFIYLLLFWFPVFPSHRPLEHYSRLDKSDFYRDYKTFNLFFYEQTYFPDNTINFTVDFVLRPFQRRVFGGSRILRQIRPIPGEQTE